MGTSVLSLFLLCAWGQRSIFKDTSQGLSDRNIKALAQDRTGFLWVGTENGLYRYDGFRFQHYGADEGLDGRAIQCLFTGPDGTLWAGTDSGIFFQRQDGGFAEVPAPFPLSRFSLATGAAFTARATDRVVVADRNGAYLLRRHAAERWTAQSLTLQGKSIAGLHYDNNGTLWYGCDFDLCAAAQGSTRHLGAAAHLPADRWLRIIEDNQGHLWLRGEQHLAEFFPQTGRAEPRDLPGTLKMAGLPILTRNGKGQMVAAVGPSYAVWEGRRWRLVTERNGLEPFDISALFADRSGLLWIAQVGHGLKREVSEERWNAYTMADGLSSSNVWATLRDHGGRLWIATEAGLDCIPAGESAPRPWRAIGVPAGKTTALAESADGAIWMGSASGGVTRIDPATRRATVWKTPKVYRLLADSQQRLWIATEGGLYVVDNANAIPRALKESEIKPSRQSFTDLSLGADHQLWAAAESALYRLDGKRWQPIDPGLSGAKPTHIAAGSQGNLWAAGSSAGLLHLRVDAGRILEAEQVAGPPLLAEKISSLLVDRRGWLWMGQDAGLSTFDGRNWHSFSADDGLLWDDCDAYALSEDRDGSLWIGTSGGLAHLLDPPAAVAEPPLQLVLAQGALGTERWNNKLNEVRWSNSPLSISIAALDFNRPRPAHLRYRLLGSDKEWARTAEGTIVFPHLPPGSYHLQVLAEDGRGGIASPPLEIGFRILPRWWQSSRLGWGFAALVLLAAALVWRRWGRLRASGKKHVENSLQHRLEELEQEQAALRRVRERMHHMGEYDDLTGLWNRRTILDRLRGEVDRSRRHQVPLSVILVDLDRFQKINEDSGRTAGDRILQEVGRILLRAVRTYDWVGRYGGGEFLVILPGSDGPAATSRGEQLRQAIESAYRQSGEDSATVTASFGVAAGSPTSFAQLLESAGEALRQAKRQGRNCVVTQQTVPASNIAQIAQT